MNTGPYGNYQANLGPEPPNPTPLIGMINMVSGNPTTMGFTSTPNSFAFDTVGLVLYESNDGVTWTAVTAGGTPAVIQVFSGHGNPNGVVTATGPALYYDLDTQVLYEKTGSGANGWN